MLPEGFDEPMKRPARKQGFREMWYETGAGIIFRPATLLHREKSPFQKIEIFRTKTFGNLAVFDDCVMLTTRCNHFYHEMMTHTLLAPIRSDVPLTVLVIGGGDCGALREVLTYRNVIAAEQVEIDERVTAVCRKFYPELCAGPVRDPRAHFFYEDGIKWVKKREGYYDIIIVDSTDPTGMAKGLFGLSFYRSCLRALKDEGSLITQTGSPLFHEKHIRQVTSNMQKAGFEETATITFPQPDYPSGWWSATIAAKGTSIVRDTYSPHLQRTKYYNAAIHEAAFAIPQFLR